MAGQVYEEVAFLNYLGVTFQRNGGFTRHHKEVSRRCNARATEAWSIGERLFKKSFKTRMQLFSSLVNPMMLYAAEVTGYTKWDEYDSILRRYIRWTLGLPKYTPKHLIMRETGTRPTREERIARAAKYENAIPQRTSITLKVA